MFFRQKLRTLFLVFGDLVAFYFSLFLAIFLRYSFQKEILFSALYSFLPVFLFWLLIFYFARIYDLNLLKNRFSYYNRIFFIFLINILAAILFFYIFYPFYRPKIVLLFLSLFSYFFVNLWHLLFYRFIKAKRIKSLIISEKEIAFTIKDYLNQNPQFGYEVSEVLTQENFLKNLEKYPSNVYPLLVIDFSSKGFLDKFLNRDIQYQIIDLVDFYEMIFQKIPVELLSLEWIAKNILNKNLEIQEALKRIFDFLIVFIALIVSLPFWPIIAFFIKISSPGPVFYISKRIGHREKSFFIYKFRTMIKNASEIGPPWTLENDSRITKIGKFLRRFHLDEIPQLINVLKGEMSFIGPRPEEEKLVELYKKEIPFYHIRFLVKPGILGWAQINYPHTASVEEAKEKFGYDVFYLKNRNFVLDLIILFRVFISIFEIKTH